MSEEGVGEPKWFPHQEEAVRRMKEKEDMFLPRYGSNRTLNVYIGGGKTPSPEEIAKRIVNTDYSQIELRMMLEMGIFPDVLIVDMETTPSDLRDMLEKRTSLKMQFVTCDESHILKLPTGLKISKAELRRDLKQKRWADGNQAPRSPRKR